MLGVHELRETDIENVSEARDRFLDQFNSQAQKIESTSSLRKLRETIKHKQEKLE
jgi:hypothetical protein